VRTDLGSSQPRIFGDSFKLEQVFINLVTNAAHAAADRDIPEIRLSASERDGFLVIAVEDNGCGIPEGDRGRIFDPFYTTKRVGEGTGLGLSVSFGIVEEHGGFIEVESQEGEGTKMSVGIPLAPARPAALAGG
jgi:signal transduction histidine kinase